MKRILCDKCGDELLVIGADTPRWTCGLHFDHEPDHYPFGMNNRRINADLCKPCGASLQAHIQQWFGVSTL